MITNFILFVISHFVINDHIKHIICRSNFFLLVLFYYLLRYNKYFMLYKVFLFTYKINFRENLNNLNFNIFLINYTEKDREGYNYICTNNIYTNIYNNIIKVFIKSVIEYLRRCLFETKIPFPILSIYEIYFFNRNLGFLIECVYYFSFMFLTRKKKKKKKFFIDQNNKIIKFTICTILIYVLFGLHSRILEHNLDVNYNFIFYVECLLYLVILTF